MLEYVDVDVDFTTDPDEQYGEFSHFDDCLREDAK